MKKNDKKIREVLKNWPLLVKKYQEPSFKKSTIQILNSFLPFITIGVLMYFSLSYSYWLTLFLALVNSLFLARIFIIQHDCGHMSFFKNRKWNNIWGTICSVFSFIPYNYWKMAHNYHHTHNGNLNFREMGDVPILTTKEYCNKSKFDKFIYQIIRSRIGIIFIVPIVYVFIDNRFAIKPSELRNLTFKKWWKEGKLALINNLFLVLIFSILIYFFGWKIFLLIYLPIIIFFAIISFWVFYIQHQHKHNYKKWEKQWEYLFAALKGSTYYKLPKILNWFSGDIGFHHIHHLSAKIPNYNLKKCHKENPIFSSYLTILTLKQSFKLINYKLWDEKRNRMITWKEFAKFYPKSV